MKPPSVRFETTIFHPNVDRDGKLAMEQICCKWQPTVSMATVLESVLTVLNSPDADREQRHNVNGEATALLHRDRDEFVRQAQMMTRECALQRPTN